MEFSKLVRRSRSYRRFDEERRVSKEALRSLVELARYAPSGANRQPIKFLLAADPSECEAMYPHLAWAGYLESWSGPEPGERPVAYIVILHDTEVSKDPGVDHGIAAQTMLLGAAEQGMGGCMLGAIKRDGIRRSFSIPERYEILLVVALGYPCETVVVEDTGSDGSIRYYRDQKDTHHVPKRTLDELIVSFSAE